MENLVTATIKSNLNYATVIGWTRKREWIGAGQAVDVDYDPWSCADRTQRQGMLSYIKAGTMEVTLHVCDASGNVCDIKMGVPETTAPIVVAAADAQESESATASATTAGTVTAVNSDAAKMGFTAKTVEPEGFNRAGMDKESDSFTVNTADVLGKSSVEDVVDNASVNKDEDTDDIAGQFDALCADHRWADALKLLINKFGEDRITFTSRAIMTLKTYAAVVEKYELE